ncbi:MAG TPA: zinc-dependent metalloprotease [Streptosporangiaceae bacterium]
MIDWNVATATGVRWVRPGPQVSLSEARTVVAELRQLAAEVAEPVRELTGLPGAPDDGIVAVVDRPGWIRANVDGFRGVFDPLVQKMAERGAPAGASVISAVGSRVTGMQAGLILAYLAGRVLGQYELFLPPDPDAAGQDAPAGRLTLVAPNIVMIERELGVDPSDFRRWVCLHEETHRTQFTSVAWLRPYVQQQMTEFLLASELDPASILSRLRAAADAVTGSGSLIEAIQSPRQREILERLTSVMTLVEGHGDYVMDAVGPSVVPSVAQIRAKFSSRRGTAGPMEQALRRILGIDLKMKQYEQGSHFVKTVVAQAGMETFNKVWTSPDTLPTPAEIAEPLEWLERVDGGHAAAS